MDERKDELESELSAITGLTFHQGGNLHAALAAHLNELITNDFSKLVYLLYRVDVNEDKLKKILRDNQDADAGSIIATMMIERQLAKIKSRSESTKDFPNDEEEKW